MALKLSLVIIDVFARDGLMLIWRMITQGSTSCNQLLLTVAAPY